MTSTIAPALAAAARREAAALLERIDGARAVLVATADGFELAHGRRQDIDVERLAAIVSSIGALGQAASQETGIGQPRCLVVESTDGRLVVRCLGVGGHDLIVAVLTDLRTMLGMVWSELKQTEQDFAAG